MREDREPLIIPEPRGSGEFSDPTPPQSASPRLTRLGRGLSVLVAFAGLGAVGYWGHVNGWRLPGRDTQPVADEWCEAHSVPEEICVACNPDRYPPLPDRGWCREHGVHQCPLCYPDIIQLPNQPEVTSEERDRAGWGLTVRDRTENNNRCLLYQRRIQFASREAMEQAGVDIALVEQRPVVETVAAPGEIGYDQTRVARLAARSPGSVWRVEKQVGDPVTAGELLALIDAAAVGDAKAELLRAHTQAGLWVETVASLRSLRGEVVSQQQVREAEASLKEARVRLLAARQALVNLGLPIELASLEGLSEQQLVDRVQFLGLSDSLIDSLDRQTTTTNLLPVTAPFAGVVVERNVVVGEVVDVKQPLLVVADISNMWLNLDVSEEDMPFVRLNQPVRFQSGRDEASGSVTWISTAADEQTRTVRVRADLPNPKGRLRASTFGTGNIVLREEPKAIMVPSAAVQWDGSCHIVFVRDKDFFQQDAPKVFHTRSVRPGVTADGYTEVIVGLWPGEVVAAQGSGVLRGELLKNDLGAG